ncbi:hypothetical protein [Mycobacteroides chelonae]|uniref:hypothetical protein n=1 Tax=Mycobacteroides chelonae TaxID=1774 RepID=UPI0006940E17|nr:hypothetical protein [Mycobacteroides chelonae]MBF9319831.1 flagellar hook-length control protein [Mycobacteroides chelonae]OHT73653.1 hypothetical protein BKG66_05055 [Mycobacteroides chelonae]OHT76210.1 hypothetical protein BKG67_01895 [Mycobacteroides chelonae]OHT91501.1 hypothetical protein BKG70_02075 [Mycobacteroides chelonae]
MSATTTADLIRAATSVARDVSDGKLDPATLESQLAEELRDLFGTVVGEDDPLWPLQTEVARGVLAAGGLDASELSEWAAVAHRRENPDAPSEPLNAPVPIDGSSTVPEPVSSVSGPHSPESDALPDDLKDVPREVIVQAEAAAMVVIDQWRASR